MEVTRISQFSGVRRTKDLPVTQEQMDDYYKRHVLVQEAFPNLTAADREFIMTGITDDEWRQLFPPEED